MNQSRNFQPGQILYLENGDTRLYGELIQVVATRGLYWVRPLFLVDMISDSLLASNLSHVSDLLWGSDFFEAALDTDVVKFFSQGTLTQTKSELDLSQRQKFTEFIHSFWQDYQLEQS
jgi:hypothetical protein